MEVMFRSSGNVLITLLKGDIDHHTASALRHTIDQSMKEFGCSDLVMDFRVLDLWIAQVSALCWGGIKKW